MEVGGQLHAPAALPPGKRLGTHCTGGWVGPRTGLDGCEKSFTFAGFANSTLIYALSHGGYRIKYRVAGNGGVIIMASLGPD